jgi:hypothetical protein
VPDDPTTTAATTVTMTFDRAELERFVKVAIRRFDAELDCKAHDFCRVVSKVAKEVGYAE